MNRNLGLIAVNLPCRTMSKSCPKEMAMANEILGRPAPTNGGIPSGFGENVRPDLSNPPYFPQPVPWCDKVPWITRSVTRELDLLHAAPPERARLDGLWNGEDFADWYPREGPPGLSPATGGSGSAGRGILANELDDATDRPVVRRLKVRCWASHRTPRARARPPVSQAIPQGHGAHRGRNSGAHARPL